VPWQPELVLCNVAVAGVPFVEHVAAARAAGFDAVSLLGRAHRRATQKDALTDADMRTILDDHGIDLADVEAVGDWLGPAPEDQPTFLHHVYPAETYLDIAAALGARNLVAVHFGAPAPPDVVASRFARLCDAAADRGLTVALEFPAFATIADVGAAWDVVKLADRPNGGILVDTWHHRRGGNDDDALRTVDGAKVLSVELSDARRLAAGGRDAPVPARRRRSRRGRPGPPARRPRCASAGRHRGLRSGPPGAGDERGGAATRCAGPLGKPSGDGPRGRRDRPVRGRGRCRPRHPRSVSCHAWSRPRA
jgi:sugar phosphate isomerase/epimerase